MPASVHTAQPQDAEGAGVYSDCPVAAVATRGRGGRGGLLLRAAWRGNTALCRELLAGGATINCQDEAGLTPLMVATLRNHVDLVRLLVTHGCDLDLTSDLGRTALHLAVWNERAAVARLLLRAGCCADRHDVFRETPLMLAAWRGSAELVAAVVGAAAAAGDVQAVGPARRTALHYAARRGASSCARALHGAGAELERRDRWGLTPLHLAVTEGNARAGLELMRLGADVNATDAGRGSVLHAAVRRDLPRVVRALLLGGAELEVPNACGNRALVASILYAGFAVTVLLVRARCDINAAGTCRVTFGAHAPAHAHARCSPVEVAAHGGRLQVAQLLVQLGCDMTGLRHSVRTGCLADKMATDGNFRRWVTHVLRTPQTLASLSRRALLVASPSIPMGGDLPVVVDRDLLMAGIPPGLIDFMNYGDILGVDALTTPPRTRLRVSRLQVLIRS